VTFEALVGTTTPCGDGRSPVEVLTPSRELPVTPWILDDVPNVADLVTELYLLRGGGEGGGVVSVQVPPTDG
jgi:hypothetical protein